MPEIAAIRYNSVMKLATVTLLVAIACLPSMAVGDFEQAEIAANEGRYEDVMTILSELLESGQLDSDKLKARAYSNRGIAYSLLEYYQSARVDLERAVDLDPGNVLALNHLGILSEQVDADFGAAAEWYKRGADRYYSASQVNLANLYLSGKGVEADRLAAIELYEAAVTQGYSLALVGLGELLLNGGNSGEKERAVELLQRAVETGSIVAHHHLGFAYEKGLGVHRDYELAIMHYEKSAERGYAASLGALGYLHRKGFGTSKNFPEAVRLYRLAADQGDAVAANRLGWLLATCPLQTVCNGRLALKYARLAVSVEASASTMDTLAAAHARIGEFDEALQIILNLLETKPLSSSAKIKYEKRLHRYSNGIPSQI